MRTPHRQFDTTVSKPAFQSSKVGLHHMVYNPRMPAIQFLNDSRHDAVCKRTVASDSYFSRCWIGKEFDVLHTLSELVKDHHTSLDERLAVQGWLHAMRIAIEEWYAESVFHIGDCS